MGNIEPHVAALLWFAAFWSVASVCFYVLSGAFPLDTRPDLKARPLGLALVGADVLLLLALAGGTLAYGVANLRWTSLVITVGFGALFAPGVFNIWPERWRDGRAGLVIALLAMATALGALATVHHLQLHHLQAG